MGWLGLYIFTQSNRTILWSAIWLEIIVLFLLIESHLKREDIGINILYRSVNIFLGMYAFVQTPRTCDFTWYVKGVETGYTINKIFCYFQLEEKII